MCPAHTLPDPCHIAWYVTARAIVGRASGHLRPTGHVSGQVSNKNRTKENKSRYSWLRGEKWRKLCCKTSILIARTKVVHVLFDLINEAIICDGNQIFLLTRRFKKPSTPTDYQKDSVSTPGSPSFLNRSDLTLLFAINLRDQKL